MGELIGQVLPLAIGIALSPVPIIAVILILFTPRARSNSIAYLAGWVLGLAIVGVLVLVLGDATAGEGEEGSTTSAVIKLVLGALLLGLALRNWRSRPAEGEEPAMPKWMSALGGFNALKSAGLALVLAGVNPKNLALTAAAALTIAATGLTSGDQGIALAAFILVSSLTVASPVVYYLVMREKADAGLTSLKGWLAANNAAVMAVLLVVFGFKLIGDGVSILGG